MLSVEIATEAGTWRSQQTYLSSTNLGTLLVTVSVNTSTFDSELLSWKNRPSMMGSHSLYVTAWCSAIVIFLASWYSRSSSQWGLRRASSRARRLCSLSCRIWNTVSWGFWFTRTSPANRHALHVFILNRYLLSVSILLQTNIITVACCRSTVVFQTFLCFYLLQLSEITFPLAAFSCISRSRASNSSLPPTDNHFAFCSIRIQPDVRIKQNTCWVRWVCWLKYQVLRNDSLCPSSKESPS